MLARFITISFVLGISMTAHAQYVRPSPTALMTDRYAAMEQFARCSVTFQVASLISNHAGMPAKAEELTGVSRGAEAVAILNAMISASEGDPASGDTQFWVSTRMRQIETFKELELNSTRAKIEAGNWGGTDIEYCVSLQPLQQVFVDIARQSGLM
jgi:hypothetical protein